jgi:hypothetical protein
MKVAGLLLLFAGWLIVLFAIALLPPALVRTLFILAAFAVELLGLALAMQANISTTRDRG